MSYYAQFVDHALLDLVDHLFDEKDIDSVPPEKWERVASAFLPPDLGFQEKLSNAGAEYTIYLGVEVIREAVRQVRELQQKS